MRYTLTIMVAAALLTACQRKPEVSHIAADNPQKSSPTFQVQAYEVDGETFLPPEKFSSTLTSHTGMVGLAGINSEVKDLQEVYRQGGYTNVRVLVPPQRVTNGVIRLKAVLVGSQDDTPSPSVALRSMTIGP